MYISSTKNQELILYGGHVNLISLYISIPKRFIELLNLFIYLFILWIRNHRTEIC